jgi:serine/threonine protein kinase
MKDLYAKRIIHRDLKPQNILLTFCDGSFLTYPVPNQITLKIGKKNMF